MLTTNLQLQKTKRTGISASYTNGSVTVSASMHDVDNVKGTATVDNKAYEINFGFAF